MKIAVVDQPFGNIILPWTGVGGSIDIWIYEMARRLARSCDVIVYTKRDRYQKKVDCDQGVRYRRVSTAFDEWYTYMSSAIDKLERSPGGRALSRNIRRIFFFRNVKRPLFASSVYYLTYTLQVAKNLKKEKCDIVHLINFSQFVSIIRAFNPKIKIVLNMTCEWLTQLNRKMIESRLREVDLVIGCSDYITKTIRCHFPEFAKRCETAYNGVDINRFIGKYDHNQTKQNGAKRLLFVGRVSPEKGLHILLNAFQKVVKRYPQAQLEIVGPTRVPLPQEFLATLSDDEKVSHLASFYHGSSGRSYFSYLHRQVISLNIANNVTFTGFVPNLQVINNYQNADILVNPSFSEAFGMSLIEAMACQVPVVATRVGGMTEIVEDGKTGILVEPGDAPALAKAILHFLSDEDLRSSMGRTARKRAVELFSWEKIVENLLYQYKKIFEGNE